MTSMVLSMAEEWWTPPAEKEKQEKEPSHVPVTFLIRPLPLRYREQVMNLLGMDEPPVGSIQILRLRGGLRGWGGALSGEKFTVDRDGCPTDETIEKLDLPRLRLVAEEVWRRSTLSEEARGN